MATMEVTFYTGLAASVIQIPGTELATTDTPVLVNSLPGVDLAIPASATIAAFVPTADMRVANSSGGAKKVVPKTRKFLAGVQYYIGVPASGTMNFLLEV